MTNMYRNITKKSLHGVMAFGVGMALVTGGMVFASTNQVMEVPRTYNAGDKVSAVEWNKMANSIEYFKNLRFFKSGPILNLLSEGSLGATLKIHSSDEGQAGSMPPDAKLEVEGEIITTSLLLQSADFAGGKIGGNINMNGGNINNIGDIEVGNILANGFTASTAELGRVKLKAQNLEDTTVDTCDSSKAGTLRHTYDETAPMAGSIEACLYTGSGNIPAFAWKSLTN